jgi:hypothetical protein
MQKIILKVYLIMLLAVVATSRMVQAAVIHDVKSNSFLNHIINKRDTTNGCGFVGPGVNGFYFSPSGNICDCNSYCTIVSALCVPLSGFNVNTCISHCNSGTHCDVCNTFLPTITLVIILNAFGINTTVDALSLTGIHGFPCCPTCGCTTVDACINCVTYCAAYVLACNGGVSDGVCISNCHSGTCLTCEALSPTVGGVTLPPPAACDPTAGK